MLRLVLLPVATMAVAFSINAAWASLLDVIDLVSHVWPWTHEYRDKHSSRGVLDGGFHPQSSHWYCSKKSFRCMLDAAE